MEWKMSWKGWASLWAAFTVIGIVAGLTDNAHPVSETNASLVDEGPAYLMVYLGSSACAHSTHDSLPSFVTSVAQSIRQRADNEGYGFHTLGVAIDWSIEEGIRHLKATASFDEISVGMNWLNQSLRRYIREEFPGLPATPQILVTQRMIHTPTEQKPGEVIRVGDEELLFRLTGLNAIREASSKGLPEFRASSSNATKFHTNSGLNY